MPIHDGERDRVLKLLELAHDERPVGPRTGVGDIEMVTAGLGLKAGRAVRRDPVAQGRVRTPEAAAVKRCG